MTANIQSPGVESVQRSMSRNGIMLFQAYLAASRLHLAMIDRPGLFDDADTDAQSAVATAASDAYELHEAEYTRLFRAEDWHWTDDLISGDELVSGDTPLATEAN